MLVLAFSVLGAIERCVYLDLDPTAAGDDCTGTASCLSIPDYQIGVCDTSNDDVGPVQMTCSDGIVKLQYHTNVDCSDNTN